MVNSLLLWSSLGDETGKDADGVVLGASLGVGPGEDAPSEPVEPQQQLLLDGPGEDAPLSEGGVLGASLGVEDGLVEPVRNQDAQESDGVEIGPGEDVESKPVRNQDVHESDGVEVGTDEDASVEPVLNQFGARTRSNPRLNFCLRRYSDRRRRMYLAVRLRAGRLDLLLLRALGLA